LRIRQFGRKSEKFDHRGQLPLFDEESSTEDESKEIEAEDESITVAKHSRKKRGRRPLPSNLPREQVIHDLPEKEKICSCGHHLHRIGEDKSEKLDFIPARLKVIEHIRYKYGCRHCEEGVKTAQLPKQPIPKSIATPGLLAHVIVSKFVDHLPLYRQEKIFNRAGIDIPRATTCNWMMKCGELFMPLISLLKRNITTSTYAKADETPVTVLSKDGRKNSSSSYMWVFTTGNPGKKSIVFEYHPTRAGYVAEEFFNGFKGFLQTDAYSGYNAVLSNAGVTGLGCWAHARRPFNDIVKISKNSGAAHMALSFIQKLYAVEREAKNSKLSAEETLKLRQTKSKPILTKFKSWLDKTSLKVLSSSTIGKAINYTLNHWVSLNVYITDGNLDIDNNSTERAIKPFALGRSNWLFCGNERGAKNSAAIYSLVETCKANNIEPYAYFRYALALLPNADSESDFEKLLPQNCDTEKLQI